MSRIFWRIFLSLLLLLAQQGALSHTLSHHAPTETNTQSEKRHVDTPLCALCLAFAHVDIAAMAGCITPYLLEHLSSAWMGSFFGAVIVAVFFAPHNRGPPLFL
ncbi:MAG: hypothetical protein IT497_01990 [Ottowia sp.]|nr:hypothetical protein [Ottowia sp.]